MREAEILQAILLFDEFDVGRIAAYCSATADQVAKLIEKHEYLLAPIGGGRHSTQPPTRWRIADPAMLRDVISGLDATASQTPAPVADDASNDVLAEVQARLTVAIGMVRTLSQIGAPGRHGIAQTVRAYLGQSLQLLDSLAGPARPVPHVIQDAPPNAPDRIDLASRVNGTGAELEETGAAKTAVVIPPSRPLPQAGSNRGGTDATLPTDGSRAANS